MNPKLLFLTSVIGPLAFVLVALFGCLRLDCTEDSEAVAYARSLSQERLARLYYDMERLSTDDSIPLYGYSAGDNSGVFPEEFSDIEVAKIRPREANIMVQGCFDHYVYMHFEGYGWRKRFYPERRIVLSWGEHENTRGSEVLWQETKSIEPNWKRKSNRP